MDARNEAPHRARNGALGAAAASPAIGEQGPQTPRRAVRALLGCARRTAVLVARRRIRQPRANVGRTVAFADATSARVYRETVVERDAPDSPAVLLVSFRLRWIRSDAMHAAFRVESELNTILFAGFPGLVSKLWLRHDQRGVYRGIYQWDGPERAVSYARAMWWILALVSEPGSVHYAVLPGLDRDEVLQDPGVVDALVAAPGGWWRPSVEGATVG